MTDHSLDASLGLGLNASLSPPNCCSLPRLAPSASFVWAPQGCRLPQTKPLPTFLPGL